MWVDCGSFGTNDFGLYLYNLYYNPADFVICNAAIVNILFQLWKNELIKGDWIQWSCIPIHNVLLPWWHFLPTVLSSLFLLCLKQIIVLQKILLYLCTKNRRMRFSFHFCCKDLSASILKIKSTEKRCNEQDFSALSSIFLFTFIFCAILSFYTLG